MHDMIAIALNIFSVNEEEAPEGSVVTFSETDTAKVSFFLLRTLTQLGLLCGNRL